MARDFYETTVTAPGAGGALVPLAGIQVYVVPRGGSEADVASVIVYQGDVGITQGPDPKAGATGTNPFTTGVSGSVRFWVEGPKEYDIIFKDSQAPARIDDRVGWNAMPVRNGSVPTALLAQDGGLKLAHLHEEVHRQQMQVGMVDDWWRPSSIVNPPAGFEICDGHQVNNHDFPGIAGPINVPDLRNVFILGADHTKAHAAAAGGGDIATQAPGINGSGGSNQHTLTSAQMPAHGHSASSGGMSDNAVHGHEIVGINRGGVAPVSPFIGFQAIDSGGNSYGIATTNAGSFAWGLIAPEVNLEHTHLITVASNGLSQPHNNMPKWVGLLRIMKVKRS